LPGYRPASPEERAAVVRTLSDYFEVRNLAAVTGDLAPLYSAHPELAHGEDRQTGVNVEAFFVERMRALQVSRVSVELEDGEPVKVYVKDAAAVAYVHGRETWDLAPGTGQTVGEIWCGSTCVTRRVAGSSRGPTSSSLANGPRPRRDSSSRRTPCRAR
jgi:hypothetical protein